MVRSCVHVSLLVHYLFWIPQAYHRSAHKILFVIVIVVSPVWLCVSCDLCKYLGEY